MQYILEKIVEIFGTDDLPLANEVAKVVSRNYPEVHLFNGKEKLAIFVPDYFLFKKQQSMIYADPKRGEKLETNLEKAAEDPERKKEFICEVRKIRGAKLAFWGDAHEKTMYDALKIRYKNRNENVAVFHSLKILKLDSETPGYDFLEKDFVIVNATYGYIMAIEGKKSLKIEHEHLEKSLNQLEETLKFLQMYFQSGILPSEDHVSTGWIFIPMVYCDNIDDLVQICDSCRRHIIKGKC